MATQPKFTPGEWRYERFSDGPAVRLPNGDTIAMGHGAALSEPDARLISAAPDLYAALCAARDTLFELPSDEEEGDKELLAQIDAAIRKAEGRDG